MAAKRSDGYFDVEEIETIVEYYLCEGCVEEAHQAENTEEYDGGKDYWGFQHVRQIEQFYKACQGVEELEISAREALKTHKLVCEIYKQGKKRM